MGIYKFDLRSIHRAELSPVTGANRILPNRKYLTTYIAYLALTTDFTILEQGPKRAKTAFTYTQLPYHCRYRGTIYIVTASPLDHKTSAQRAASHRKLTRSLPWTNYIFSVISSASRRLFNTVLSAPEQFYT